MFRMMSVTSSITPGEAGELVVRALELTWVTAAPSRRGEQDAAEAVADGRAEAAFERLGGELAVRVGGNCWSRITREGSSRSTPTNSHDHSPYACVARIAEGYRPNR